MPIYYRADTRSPEEIFKYGFQPSGDYKLDIKQPKWWKLGIRSSFDIECVSEAESTMVVCMTTCFNSAPMFPVDESNTTYIYAMELPENEVFDFYQYQFEQAIGMLAGSSKNSGVVAVGLCGYEAFTPKVSPKNILAAIKCERSGLTPQTAGLQVYDSKYKFIIPVDRKFIVGSELFLNEKFKRDGSALASETIAKLESRLNTKAHTTSIADAIEKARLPKPKTTPLLLLHLRNGYIKEALISVFRSIYHGIKNISSMVYNVIFPIVEDIKEKKITYINTHKENENANHDRDTSFCQSPIVYVKQMHDDQVSARRRGCAVADLLIPSVNLCNL